MVLDHRAEIVATLVWEAGHYALCPHANARHASAGVSDAQYLAGTLELMRRSDAVIVLPRYQSSEGTCGEISDALNSGMPVAYLARFTAQDVARCLVEIHAHAEAVA